MPAGLDSSGARRLGGGLLSDLWRLANPCRDPGTRRPATASLRTLRRRLANGAVALSLLRRARSRTSRLAGVGGTRATVGRRLRAMPTLRQGSHRPVADPA